jgi:hypothetical protein
MCLDSLTGNVTWQSEFLGAELYVSPTYGDGKLYVVSDQRSIYILNATDGSKLSYFPTKSNSWSSPTLYEGRLYVGNNDWNVYCLATYPPLVSNLTVELDAQEVFTGQTVTCNGVLLPRRANTAVAVTLVDPTGAQKTINVYTCTLGNFTFTFSPEVPGNWSVYAQWTSDESYCTSSKSEPALLAVNPSPTPTPTQTPTPTPTPTSTDTPTPTPSESPTLHLHLPLHPPLPRLDAYFYSSAV